MYHSSIQLVQSVRLVHQLVQLINLANDLMAGAHVSRMMIDFVKVRLAQHHDFAEVGSKNL